MDIESELKRQHKQRDRRQAVFLLASASQPATRENQRCRIPIASSSWGIDVGMILFQPVVFAEEQTLQVTSQP